MNCRFCPELLSEIRASEFHEITEREVPSRFIWESDNFVMFPALGHIVPGHVLLVTKRHRLSMSQVPAHLFAEMEEALSVTRAKVEDAFGSRVLVYEHGQVVAGASCGACVDHAHLHVVPIPDTGTPDEAVRRTLTAKYEERAFDRYSEVAALADAGRGYLMVEDTTRRRFVYEADAVPSQYLRRVVCDAIGKTDRWDWRANILADTIEGTIATVRETMERLGANVGDELRFDRAMEPPVLADACR